MIKEQKVTLDYSAWRAELKGVKTKFPMRYPETQGEIIQPQYAIEVLHEVTKGNAIITTGVGQHQMFAAQWCVMRTRLRLLVATFDFLGGAWFEPECSMEFFLFSARAPVSGDGQAPVETRGCGRQSAGVAISRRVLLQPHLYNSPSPLLTGTRSPSRATGPRPVGWGPWASDSRPPSVRRWHDPTRSWWTLTATVPSS